MVLSNLSWLTVFLLVAANPTSAQAPPEDSLEGNPYWHRKYLGLQGNYRLEWQVNWAQERVIFNVTVATQGYVALGIARNAKMTGADIVMGGVLPNGSAYFSDMHAIGNQQPVRDQQQNWVLHSAKENETHTSLSFSRVFDTCDPQDIPIGDDSVYVLWAYGERDNMTEYHYNNRGSFVDYLRDPDLTPESILDENMDHDISTEERTPIYEGGTRVQIWELEQSFKVPPRRTTYMCYLRKFTPPTPKTKHHLIGYNFKITPEANMHHMLLFRCRLPVNVGAALLYEPFMNKSQECYSLEDVLGPIQTQFCSDTVIGHAIGGKPLFINEEMGIPIGDTAAEEYFVWQVHYDNPGSTSNLTVDIKWDLYYTPRLRENDGSILSLGHHIPAVPSILLPPGQQNHRFFGHCSPACTRRMIPPEGIRFTGALLHTHQAGRRVRIQHFRNGRELPWILNDDNYDFSFQPFRTLRREVVVLPGDQVSVQCYYDTTSNNATLVGGYGTDQEMCKTFIVYYNKLQDYPLCRSEIDDSDYMARYLVGTTGLRWDQSSLEFRATSPQRVAGRTVSNISDSGLVNWDLDLRSQLRRDHISLPQTSLCVNLNLEGLVRVAMVRLGIKPPLDKVSFPVHASEYQPPQRCTLGK